jgi:hypothetical protein
VASRSQKKYHNLLLVSLILIHKKQLKLCLLFLFFCSLLRVQFLLLLVSLLGAITISSLLFKSLGKEWIIFHVIGKVRVTLVSGSILGVIRGLQGLYLVFSLLLDLLLLL